MTQTVFVPHLACQHLGEAIANLFGHLQSETLAKAIEIVETEDHRTDVNPVPGGVRQRLGHLHFQIFTCKQSAHRILNQALAISLEVFLSTGQVKQVIQAGQQFCAARPLGHEIRNPQLLGLETLLLRFLTGNQDERQLLKAPEPRCPQTLKQLVTVQLGHLQIGNHCLDRMIDHQGLPCRLAVTFLPDLVMRLQVMDERHPDHPRIIDDQDVRQIGHISLLRYPRQRGPWPARRCIRRTWQASRQRESGATSPRDAAGASRSPGVARPRCDTARGYSRNRHRARKLRAG
ncbi:hypothetical protein SDC9_152916 [bioreactor metagenome]|uniref:Uncharacterized protein n=1 Tax=bioreactor metagenome TaxID=1076179 RepID=A0A645EUG4_9ZZZZ